MEPETSIEETKTPSAETENNAAPITPSAPELTGEAKAAQMKADDEAAEKVAAEKMAADKKAALYSGKLSEDKVRNLRTKLDFMKTQHKKYAREREIMETAGKTSHHKSNIYAGDIKQLEEILKDY